MAFSSSRKAEGRQKGLVNRIQGPCQDSGESKKVYVDFSLKDGTSQYDLSERSLGFRWFFSFLLFTLYRVSAKQAGPTLFLLDEPASNLHSRAQMQLLESLPKIATGSNQIMYSTHSHYMINPEWLDQAFIVSNSAIDYDDVTETSKNKNRHTDVHVDKYRTFVGKNPDKTTYFQPVLDKLDVSPSKIDLVRPSVLVEGKGDYIVLEYGRRVVIGAESEYAIVPTRGAAGMDELVGLFLGWGVPFVICLDDDQAGVAAKGVYIKEWGLSESRVFTLKDVDLSLSGKRIEDLLEGSDLDAVRDVMSLTSRPTKSQIQLFFSEKLARRERVSLSEGFQSKVRSFDRLISRALNLEGSVRPTPSAPAS